jgi:hypothetical protein
MNNEEKNISRYIKPQAESSWCPKITLEYSQFQKPTGNPPRDNLQSQEWDCVEE